MKPTRHYSKKQETTGNKALGFKNVANSGATTFSKGDGKDEHILMEWKTKTKPSKSHTIHKEWFTKHKEETFAMGRRFSVLGFDFGDGENIICLEQNDFKEMYEAWKELHDES